MSRAAKLVATHLQVAAMMMAVVIHLQAEVMTMVVVTHLQAEATTTAAVKLLLPVVMTMVVVIIMVEEETICRLWIRINDRLPLTACCFINQKWLAPNTDASLSCLMGCGILYRRPFTCL